MCIYIETLFIYFMHFKFLALKCNYLDYKKERFSGIFDPSYKITFRRIVLDRISIRGILQLVVENFV